MIDRIKQWTETRQGRQVVKVILNILLVIVIAVFIAGCVWAAYDAIVRKKQVSHDMSQYPGTITTWETYAPFAPVEDE